MFIDSLKDALNISTTENGALGYATTGKALVDFNFKVASMRNWSEENIKREFKKVWYENKELALKYLFYVRDVREGLGERRLFREVFKEIVNQKELKDNIKILKLIPEFGRWDDLISLMGINDDLTHNIVDIIRDQMVSDIDGCMKEKSISLMAKWLPSINTSSTKSKTNAKLLCKQLGVKETTYRKTLSKLRKYIDVIERKLCANEWDKVNYETVPSNANLKYKDAFLKHDEDRRKKYLESLEKGETKINGSVLFPHDIVAKYRALEKDEALEALWKSLPNYVDNNTNTLVVRDGSASMTWGNTKIKPLDVATALAIYFSEKCEGQFKDNFITFSSKPELVSLTNYETLRDKLVECYNYNDCSNTNLEATFDLVLDVAVKNHLKQEEIPNLLIISDMEFDISYSTSRYLKDKLFKTIEDKFNKAGYQLPKLIFWNVASRTNTVPLTQNKNGVILVSGFSPAITKMVLSEELDPYKALVKELMKGRYKEVTLGE